MLSRAPLPPVARHAFLALLSISCLAVSPAVWSEDRKIEDMPLSFDDPDLQRMTAALTATPPDGQKAIRAVLGDCILSDEAIEAIGDEAAKAKRFANKCRTSYDAVKARYAAADNVYLFDYVREIEEPALHVAERAQSGPVNSDTAMVLSVIAVGQRINIGRLRQLMNKMGLP